MLRIHKALACLAIGTAAWLAALGRPELQGGARTAVLLAPLAGLAAFGAYAAILLLVGILSFRDCPEDAAALQKEIAAARADLIARGVLDKASG